MFGTCGEVDERTVHTAAHADDALHPHEQFLAQLPEGVKGTVRAAREPVSTTWPWLERKCGSASFTVTKSPQMLTSSISRQFFRSPCSVPEPAPELWAAMGAGTVKEVTSFPAELVSLRNAVGVLSSDESVWMGGVDPWEPREGAR